MSRPTRAARPLRLLAPLGLALGLIFLAGSPSEGLIRHAITIDGNVADWGDVLTDPENVVADAGSFSDPVDPDVPGTADRDLRGVAFTWDNTNLYFFFRRTLSGNSSFDFLAYIDRGHDKKLQSTDRILRLTYNGAAYQGGGLNAYVPVNVAAGDDITGDGVDEPGQLGAPTGFLPTSANSPDGIEFEGSISWAALGVPAGTCLWIHPAISRGTNLPGQLEDNTNPLDTQDVAVRLESDRAGSAASPGSVDYAHRVCNDGNCADTMDLGVRSNAGWRVEIYTDPNGDGNPADGVLRGVDGNGDGDYSDDRDGDSMAPGADTNGNGVIDSGSLAAGTCFTYVVRIFAPSGLATGTTDLERVRARSSTRPQDLKQNTDTTTVGPITIFKDESRTAFAGDEVWTAHRACNNQAFADTLNLSTSSTLGWTTEIWSDPNGDGDPIDGALITSTGSLAPGACFNLISRVVVPGGTATGTINSVTVRATSAASSAITDVAIDTITVQAARFALTPSHVRDAGPFNTLFLPHVVTNNQGLDDSFSITVTGVPVGWTATLLSDPNGNGEPDDSATIANGGVIGPAQNNGGQVHFLLRVDIPQGAAIGTVGTITITARSQLDTTRTSVATDTITIRRILTYSDPLFARPSATFFVSCAKVYVQAHALQSNRDYRFKWYDPANALQRTSPTYTADARGRADDSFSLPCGLPPGTWKIDLEIRSGSTWSIVSTANFSTFDPAVTAGDITRLETDQGIYNVLGDTFIVESELNNDTTADYLGTRADYVVFRDANGDGVPTAGEDYIQSDGTRSTWDPGEFSHRTSDITVYAGATFQDFWSIANADFDIQGTWCVHERWYQICTSGSCSEVTIDTALTCFLVSCLPAPVVNAGANKQACLGDVVAMSDATSDANAFQWSDGGAGGSFSPSATVLNPSYTPPGLGTFTLTLTGTFTATGCSASDTVTVTVNPNPTVTAGADKSVCAGDPAALSDADGGIADTFSWSDGGAGGTFAPSASVENPSYSNATPGAKVLTFMASVAATGCDNNDTVTVTINANPVVTAGADKTTCSDLPIALSDADGGIADTFAWSDGGAGGAFSPSAAVENPTYSNLTAGVKTLTLTATVAATGCQRADTVAITINAAPVITAGADKAACAGEGVALLDASGGAADSFAWTDGGAGGTFTPSASVVNPTYSNATPGVMTLTFTATVAATGCDSVDTVNVTVNANPVVTAGADKGVCSDSTVSLSDADGGAADMFSWSDGGAGGVFAPSALVENPTYSNAAAGTHVLTLTATIAATGCDSADTVSVTVNATPVANAGADKTICSDETAALSDADGGIGDTFAWSDGGAGGTFTPSASVENPTYANAAAGTHTLTFTASIAATGCDSVDTVKVTVNEAPVVSAGADKTACAGAPVALSDADGGVADTFSWSDGGAGGSFAPSASVENPSYSNAAAGTHVLTLTASVGVSGCANSDTVSVTINAVPVANAGANKAVCSGASVALSDADGGVADTFAWSDGGAGGTFTPSASVENPAYSNATAGSYTLTFTASVAATGCQASDTLTMTVNAHPSVDAGAPKDGCAGAPVALSDATSDGATFSWSDGGGGGSFAPSATVLNPSYTNATAGSYTLTLVATSSASCTSTDTVDVTIRVLPVALFAPPAPPICEDTEACFDNTSTGATSYLWEFGDPDANTSTDAEPCFAYTSAGTYTVRLTATNSCGSSSVTHSVTVSPKPVADFSFDTQGNRFCKNKNVNFTDLSTQSPTSWQWDFDDGTTSTLQNPTHAYLTDGVFIVSLVACNACGCSAPAFQAVEIAASCNTNCEANSNQIECSGPPTVMTGDTCTDHDNFNTTSYPCAPDIVYGGENKSFDLNFLAGSNFIVRLTETVPEPNGYDLDVMISDRCNPPRCVAWGDTEVAYDDRTAVNDDFFLIVDGRDGSCGPYRLDIDCIDDTEAAACTKPTFDGIVDAKDLDPCSISGILVTWNPAADWGLGTDGAPCPGGTYEIWRAPVSDPTDERRVGTAPAGATSFLDENAIPGLEYIYKVHAINTCCGEVAITAAEDQASDEYNQNAVTASAGPDRSITCTVLSVTLVGSASGGTGGGFDYSWAPTAGLSDPTRPNPTATIPGTYTLTVTDRDSGCSDTDVVVVADNDGGPTVSAGADKEITCAAPTVTLDGAATGGDASAGRVYSWSPSGPLSDPASPTPTTSTPGTYTLTVTDTATGCVASDDVDVAANDVAPIAGAGPDKLRDCDTPSVTLDGSATGGDGRDGFTYLWSPAAGLDDATAQSPSASAAGTWTVTVTDVHTGCSDTDTVTVTEDLAAPTAGAGPDQLITCTITEVALDGSASGGNGSAGYSFAWSPPEQVSDPAAENPTTSEAGTYTLTVTDLANGCTSTDAVVVTLSPDVPVANAGPDKEITCTQLSALLEGSASGGDGSLGYSFHWEPALQVSDPDIAQPTTTTPGTYTLTIKALADGCQSEDTMIVADNDAPPTASAGADALIDCGNATVVLQGAASGGDGSEGYTFAWTPATGLSDASIAQPTASQAGTYTVTVTDVHTGCTASDDVVVNEDFATPTAAAGPDKLLDCLTTSVTLDGAASGGNGSGGYAFAWTPATGLSDAAIAQPTATAPGTYTLTVTDLVNDCTDVDTVTVAQDVAAPVTSAGPDKQLDCDTASVVLEGAASGGNGSAGYSFSWTPTTGLSDPSIAQPTSVGTGTFTLTVTDLANGCVGTDTVVVTQNTTLPTANAGPDRTLDCDTLSMILSGSASGGDGSAGYSYSWTPTAGLSDPLIDRPSATVPGTYTLTVTAIATGCQDTDTVLVIDDTQPPIVANAGPDKTLECGMFQVPLDGSASGGHGSASYAYLWRPAAGLVFDTTAQPFCSAAGVYTLTVTDTVSGCTSTDTVTVTEDRVPPIANAGADKVLDCDTPVVTLDGSASAGNGSAGYRYSWTPRMFLSDPDIANPTTTRTGTYTLTVTDLANNCTDTDQVVVTRDVREPVANAGPDKVITCANPTVILSGSASGGNGSAGYSYSWSPAAALSDPLIAQPTASAPGSYVLTVVDLANGCSDTNTVVVTEDLRVPVVGAGADKVLDCDTSSVTLDGTASGGNGSAGYSYRWSPATGLSDPLIATPSATAPALYTVTVTDIANGCTATDTVAVTEDIAAPVVTAGLDKQLDCVTTSVSLDGAATGGNGSAGYSYSWSPTTGLSDPLVAQPMATAAGTYTLTVTDLANGCRGTDSVIVSLAPGTPSANAGLDQQQSCTNPVVTLTGAASGGDGSLGYSYRWEPAADVANPDVAITTTAVAGTYTLTITDIATGCTASDSVVVTGSAGPTAGAGNDADISCLAPAATLTGTASGGDGSLGYEFRWEPAADVADPNAAITTTTVAGTYTLTVTDIATGCIAIDTVTITSLTVPAFPEPSALDVNPTATPLRVTWVDPAGHTTLDISWEDVGAFEYRVYQGTIANFLPPRGAASYDHGALSCGLATPRATPPVMAGGVYFIAVSANCDGVESSYGRDSSGTSRPDALTASGNPCP